jgi:hypothetical protein
MATALNAIWPRLRLIINHPQIRIGLRLNSIMVFYGMSEWIVNGWRNVLRRAANTV